MMSRFKEAMVGFLVGGVLLAMVSCANGADIPWSFDARLTSVENRLDKVEAKVGISTTKTAASTAGKIRDTSGNYWTVRSDGLIEWCTECNGRPNPVSVASVSWPPGMGTTSGVVATAPFDRQYGYTQDPYTIPPTSALTAGGVSTASAAVSETGGTPIRARTAGRPGIIRRVVGSPFRLLGRIRGGCATGGCGS